MFGQVLQLTLVFKISPTNFWPGLGTVSVYLLSVTLNQQNKCGDSRSQLSLFVLHRQCSPAVFLLTLHCREDQALLLLTCSTGGSSENNPLSSVNKVGQGKTHSQFMTTFYLLKLLFIERACPL